MSSGVVVKYGDFAHPVGQPAVVISKETEYTDGRTPWATRVRWDISGHLANPTGDPNTLNTAIGQLKEAYAVDGRDLVMLLPDGTASTHVLRTADTLGGVRVVAPPSFPEGTGPELRTMRTFSLALEAVIPLADPETALRSFQETLTFSGGGRRYGHLEPNAGAPVKQLLKQQTVFRATQSGRAVGLYRYPPMPLPMWPAARVEENPEETRTSPQRTGSALHDYTTTWTYSFASAIRLVGNPNAWGFA